MFLHLAYSLEGVQVLFSNLHRLRRGRKARVTFWDATDANRDKLNRELASKPDAHIGFWNGPMFTILFSPGNLMI
jgi:hypothetical protein